MYTSNTSRLSRSRLALLALLAVYPLVTALFCALAPLLDRLPIYQRSAILCPVIVAIMIWVVVPSIQSVFGGFINVDRTKPSQTQDNSA